MQTVRDVWLKLLRCFLTGEVPDLPEGVDWNALAKLSEIHNVQGMLGAAVDRLPPEAKPEPPVAEALEKALLATVRQLTERVCLFEALLKRFDAENISYLLFKGAVLRDYYPIPELRTFGDIDLLIRPEDRDRSDALMRSLGFSVEVTGRVYTYRKEPELYEIHTALIDEEINDNVVWRDAFADVWAHATPDADNPHRFLPTPEYHLVYLLTHLAKHLHNDGAGIRQYMDIACLLHGEPTLDLSAVEARLEALGLTKFAKLVFFFLRRWFGEAYLPGLATGDAPDDALIETFEAHMAAAGVFGVSGRSQMPALIRKSDGDRGAISTGRGYLRYFFLPYEEMCSRCKWLTGKRWLLPAAWVWRSVRGLAIHRRLVTHRLRHMKQTARQASEQQEFLSRIGLLSDRAAQEPRDPA